MKGKLLIVIDYHSNIESTSTAITTLRCTLTCLLLTLQV